VIHSNGFAHVDKALEMIIENGCFSGAEARSGERSLVTIYPNPVGNSLHVNIGRQDKATLLEIFDMTGRVYFSQLMSSHGNSILLDVSGFQSGNYLLRTTNEHHVSNNLFIKI